MKKVLRSVAVLAVSGILLVSCSKNNAKTVATAWLNDFYHADYDGAMPLSTETTKAQLDQFSQLSSYLNDSAKKDLKKIKVTIKDVKEKGDTAIATYTIPDNPKDQTIMLVKQNGKWLVAFTKNESFNMSDYVPDLPPGTDSTGTSAVPSDTSAKDTAKNRD